MTLCRQFSPDNLRNAQRNAFCCRILPEILENIFARQLPSAAVVWNFFPPFNTVREKLLQKNIPTLTTDKGLLGKTAFLDPCGMNGSSYYADPDTWSKTVGRHRGPLDLAAAAEYLASYVRSYESGWDQPGYEAPENLRKRFGIRLEQKIIFVPTQVLADSNMILHHGAFHDNTAFIRAFLVQLRERNDLFFLIKKHPKEPSQQAEIQHIIADRGIWTENINTFSAIEACSAVITLNSTVGLEAAMLGKPVAVCAPALYSRKGFTYDITDVAMLPPLMPALLSGWQQSDEQRLSLLYFLAFMLKKYLIPANGVQPAAIYDRYLEPCMHYDTATGTTDREHLAVTRMAHEHVMPSAGVSRAIQKGPRIKNHFATWAKSLFKKTP